LVADIDAIVPAARNTRFDHAVIAPRRPPFSTQPYRLGQATLAPVFAAFAELLLAESRRRGFDRLAFLARDGYFLKIVTECIAASSTSPQLIYAHLTRRSTSLAAAGRLQTREIATPPVCAQASPHGVRRLPPTY
jgi:hypothetical protein